VFCWFHSFPHFIEADLYKSAYIGNDEEKQYPISGVYPFPHPFNDDDVNKKEGVGIDAEKVHDALYDR
jgi:hypothetical protein